MCGSSGKRAGGTAAAADCVSRAQGLPVACKHLVAYSQGLAKKKGRARDGCASVVVFGCTPVIRRSFRATHRWTEQSRIMRAPAGSPQVDAQLAAAPA